MMTHDVKGVKNDHHNKASSENQEINNKKTIYWSLGETDGERDHVS